MSTNLGTALIGGGSGFVGSYVQKALRLKGYHVRIVSRRPGPLNMSWTELQKDGLPPDCKAVIGMAGQNIFDMKRRWTEGFKQNVWSSRVNTSKWLANGFRADEKPQIFISMSGVGYYKPSHTAEYTEDSPGGDFDFLSELASDWESATNLESKNVRKVIIRSGVVLGTSGGIIKQMKIPFFLGVGGPTGDGRQYFPWIQVWDLAGIMMFAIDNPKVSDIINGVAPQIITNKQFAKALGKAMWRPAIFPVPKIILNAAFSEERAKIMTEGQKVIPKRLLELGYKYDFSDILSACKECAPLIYRDKLNLHN